MQKVHDLAASRTDLTRSTTCSASSPTGSSCTAIGASPRTRPSCAASARFHGRSVVVVGHQKGRGTKENMTRNFGMPRPEGYRKAIRMYEMADRFGLPMLTFIDTPGAYPGIGAEERGQSEAIGAALGAMAEVERSHRGHHHRRRRLGRRARARRRQPRAGAGVRLLLGHLARRMRGASSGRTARAPPRPRLSSR